MESHAEDRFGHNLTLVIYSSMTIFGIIAASTWKDYINAPGELTLLIVGSAVSVAIAHGWAGLIELQVEHKYVRLGLSLREMLGHAVAVIVPAGIGCAAIFVALLLHDSFQVAVLASLGALTLTFSLASGMGARRGGLDWPRSIGWAAAGLLAGCVLMLLKSAT